MFNLMIRSKHDEWSLLWCESFVVNGLNTRNITPIDRGMSDSVIVENEIVVRDTTTIAGVRIKTTGSRERRHCNIVLTVRK